MSSAALGRFAHTPLVITTGSNDVIVEQVGGVDRNATIAAGTYYVRGDGAADDLLAAVKTALDATASAVTYTLTIASHTGSTRGFITVAGDGAFILRFSQGANTFNELYLGFPLGVDTASGTSVTSTLCALQLWYPQTEGSLYDNDEQSERRRNGALSGYMHTSTLTTYDVQRVVFEFVDRSNVKTTYAAATHLPFQAMWTAVAAGGRFLHWPDNDDTTVAEWVIDDDRWCERLSNAAEVMATGGERYRITIPMREYIAAS